MDTRTKVVILGAAGRDFHNFNVAFRNDPAVQVVAFTAAQIPGIEDRRYPPDLAGPLYPDGIPIRPESDLPSIIKTGSVNQAVFSYSDVSHEELMHTASLAVALGADFRLLGSRATMLSSKKPVVSVCAVRTGAGKSPVSRRVAAILRGEGLRVSVVRHPMPYGDLSRQAVQRFASLKDLDRAACTIEEREEYEPHLAAGNIVYAGVDYERILRDAEKESDVVLWDGGNNDTSFYRPDLEIVVLDPHRAGHERSYFPGEVNFLRAHAFVLNKLDTALPGRVERVRLAVHRYRPGIPVVDTAMPVTVDDEGAVRGRRALVIEDGPTLTHGGMRFGAGILAAERFGAAEIVDPRPFAVGTIRETFEKYPHLDKVLPAMGYGDGQVRELEETIRKTPCDVVLIATPVDLRRIVRLDRASIRVGYDLQEMGKPDLTDILRPLLTQAKRHG